MWRRMGVDTCRRTGSGGIKHVRMRIRGCDQAFFVASNCADIVVADVRNPGPREFVWRVSELCYRRAPVRAFSIHGNDALLSGNSLALFAGPAMEVQRLRAALA